METFLLDENFVDIISKLEKPIRLLNQRKQILNLKLLKMRRLGELNKDQLVTIT